MSTTLYIDLHKPGPGARPTTPEELKEYLERGYYPDQIAWDNDSTSVVLRKAWRKLTGRKLLKYRKAVTKIYAQQGIPNHKARKYISIPRGHGIFDYTDSYRGVPQGRSWKFGQNRLILKKGGKISCSSYSPKIELYDLIQGPLATLMRASTELVSVKSIEVILGAYRKIRSFQNYRKNYLSLREVRKILLSRIGWVISVRWD